MFLNWLVHMMMLFTFTGTCLTYVSAKLPYHLEKLTFHKPSQTLCQQSDLIVHAGGTRFLSVWFLIKAGITLTLLY